MTVTTTQARFQFTSNGVTAGFPFNALFVNPADLAVDLRDPAGIAWAGVLNGAGSYDYSVVGTLDPTKGEYLGGATVIFNTVPPGGWLVTLFDDPPEKQLLPLPPTGSLPPAGIEAELDKLTLQIQALRDRLNRSLSGPVQDPLALTMALPPAAARAGGVLGFDPIGQPAVGPPGSLAALLALLAPNPPLPQTGTLPAVTIPSGGAYTAISGGYPNGGYIWVYRSSPTVATLAMPAPTNQMLVIVKDTKGDAGQAPITLSDSSNNLFDGRKSLSLTDPYAGVLLAWSGSSWSQLA